MIKIIGKISCVCKGQPYNHYPGTIQIETGRSGIAVAIVFLKDENGLEYSGALPCCILRVPKHFLRRGQCTFSFGPLRYRISKTDAPWSDITLFSQSNDSLINPVSYTFTIGKEAWMFEVAPQWMAKQFSNNKNQCDINC